MKTLITAIALTAALSTPVFAGSDHDHQEGGGMKDGVMQGEMMGMMDQKNMGEMHGNMQEMKKVMADIKQETDPKKRQQLMHKHMQSMQQGMGMMMGDMKREHAMEGHKEMSVMQMNERMGMMEKHMKMMQMMMDQMMQHNSEDEKQRMHNKH